MHANFPPAPDPVDPDRGDGDATPHSSISAAEGWLAGATDAAGASGASEPDIARLRRIGGGASADVYALAPDRVLKLLRPGLSAALAARERAAAEVAWSAGLATAQPRELASVAGRAGIVFDRLREPALLHRLRRWPGWVLVTLAALARYQVRLHRTAAPDDAVASGRDAIAARIGETLASPAARRAAQAALARLPDGDALCHGDLHLGNVMTVHGRLHAIDWAQATLGHPAADVARTELITRYGRYGPALRRWPALRLARHAAAAWYLLCYRALTGMRSEEIAAWRLPVAAAWLRAGTAAHLPSLAAYVERLAAQAEALRGAAMPPSPRP